jgi:general secretion pathway protein L
MPQDPDLAMSPRSPRLAFERLARRLGVAGFWRWWADELAPLVPAGTRTAVQRRRTRPVLAFGADHATLWHPVVRDGRLAMSAATQIPLTGDSAAIAAAGRAALAPLTRVVYGGVVSAPRVVVALSPRQVLRRTLTLPAAIEQNLKQALAYDLDRHTPFKAEELYFDAVVVGRDAARGEIRVDLAAARRGLVDQAVRHAESFGAIVASVAPDAPGGLPSRLNLLAGSARQQSAPWARWQFWLPIVVLASVALAAVVLPLWQKRAYAIVLARVTDEARGQAAVSESLRAELDRLTSDYNFVLERKNQFPPNVEVLNEVTKLLPDDTWLLQMEVKNSPRAKEPQRELLLRGESANAGRLITAFEESKAFTQAAPRSPTTKIQPGPGEIFDLVAQVRPATAPAALPLIAAVAEGAVPPAVPDAASPAAASGSQAPAAPGAAGAPGAQPSGPGSAAGQAESAAPAASAGPGPAAPAPAPAPAGPAPAPPAPTAAPAGPAPAAPAPVAAPNAPAQPPAGAPASAPGAAPGVPAVPKPASATRPGSTP